MSQNHFDVAREQPGQMLTIVNDQQELLGGEICLDPIRTLDIRRRHLQSACEGRAHQLVFRDFGHLGKTDAVFELESHPPAEFQRNARFSDTAGAGNRDNTASIEHLLNVAQIRCTS
ncbi:hypothetical protein [Rhizobium sp. SG570]|uniref:hypothetical protein n=1 Tax=Rhizobium sp. SG570 TaxID=2587113 RepID=UPI0017F2E4BE|nr:hypothetical protein [Rhizobium sp. SG570]NKJ39373.1 hypothetical protein [Rhizobium sp. SG570]